MQKRTKNNRQKKWKGGADVMSIFSNAWNQTKKTSKDVFSNLSQQSQNLFSNKSVPNKTIPTTTNVPNINSSSNLNNNQLNTTNYTPNDSITPTISKNSVGGKKKKIGGGPAPVHNLDVAKPTYWIKGGKKGKGKKGRKTKKRSYKRK